MPFEIPQNIHENCARLAWLLGTWEGSGKGDYPSIEPFEIRSSVANIRATVYGGSKLVLRVQTSPICLVSGARAVSSVKGSSQAE